MTCLQIDSGEINGSISADDTVMFSDPVPQFSKDELDEMLVAAQTNSRVLLETERMLNASKEYLTKVRFSSYTHLDLRPHSIRR